MKIQAGILALAAMLTTGAVRADAAVTFYMADMSGARVVPASPSGGRGIARLTVTDDESSVIVTVFWSSHITAPPTIRVHGPAVPGANGPVLFTVPTTIDTQTRRIVTQAFPIAPAQLQDLKAGRWYVDIVNGAFPGGEIRGQIEVNAALTASLSTAQVVPFTPSASSARARAWVSLDESNTVALVTMFWNDLSSPVEGGHLHLGRSGTNGPVICDLATPGVANGQILDVPCSVTPAQAAALRAGQAYIDLDTATPAHGEVRGQIKRSFNPCDFDGDGRSDPTVVRPTGSTLVWWVLLSNGGVATFEWGLSSDFLNARLICTDFDGDGKAEPTVFRPGPLGFFLTRLSSTGQSQVRQWGTTGDDPRAVGDYDGDGRDDLAVYRAGIQSQYWIRRSTDDAVVVQDFGTLSDRPQFVPDYDGDGRTDVGVLRDATYWTRHSSDNSVHVIPFGLIFDATQSLDFDGDGRTDIANGRNANDQRQWWILGSLTGGPVLPFGSGVLFGSTSVPGALRTSADYNGDGRAEIAIFKSANDGSASQWWTLDVKTGAITVTPWGINGDFSLQTTYWK